MITDFDVEQGNNLNENLLGLSLMIDQLGESDIGSKHLLYAREMPHWYFFKDKSSLREKINTLNNISLIGNTDFEQVFQFILHEYEHQIYEKNLVILSDTNFNQSVWKQLSSRFSSVVSDSKINIIYWTVNQPLSIRQFHFDKFNIQVIQGFHFFLLTHLFKENSFPDSYTLIRRILDSRRYFKIKDICQKSHEGRLSSFQFKNDWVNLD